jgi:uroporphyrinogen-III synthase
MTGRLVLNTRPRDQAEELSRQLRAAGFESVEAPAIATISAWYAPELDQVRRSMDAGLYDWIVLPSQNAGRDLLQQLRTAQARLVCGTSTAIALGLDGVALTLDRFSAAAAVDALRGHIVPNARVLVPHAAEGRDELVEGLRLLGANVHAPIAYRTVSVPDALLRLREGGIEVVTLCSPSAVQSITNGVRDQIVVCLGETTATAARAAGMRVDGVATQTSIAALVDAVSTALGARV